MRDLTNFYQQFIPRIKLFRLQTPSKKLTYDDFDISMIAESFEEINLSFNQERDAKRKKSRRKSGKKSNEIKHTQQSQNESSQLNESYVDPNIDNAVCLKKEVWSKVSDN